MKACLIAALLLLASCSQWEDTGEYIYVGRAGADMPVWIRGNVDSGKFIITLHGGPGYTGHAFVFSDGFRMLEEDYAIVYWDQRASGLSQGNPSQSTFTVEEFVADTDGVISVIQRKYGVDRFVLYGHSWGGNLALAYMVLGAQVDEVAAFIAHAGSHNEFFSIQESRTWILDRIDRYIADGDRVGFWEEARRWYEARPTFPPSQPEHYLYLNESDAYYFDPETEAEWPGTTLAFRSPFTVGWLTDPADRGDILAQRLLDDFDYTDEMATITSPALILSGAEDGTVPPSVAELTHSLLGTPIEDRRLLIVDEVAHTLHEEKPEVFYDAVSDIVETYLTPTLE